MRDAVERERPDLLELATELVGADPFERIGEGTRFQQPAIFCASLVGWMQARELSPAALAGHSLGEITALVAAGALVEADGLRLVATRARLMQEAGEAADGGMIAVRAGRAEVEPLIAGTGAVIANDNAPKQIVLSGEESALALAEEKLKEARIKALRLRVSAAFHSPVMQPAVAGFREAVRETTFAPSRIPVVSCSLAAVPDDPGEALVDGLTSQVRWVETQQELHRRGIRRFVETGPGKVLTGLARRTLPDVEVETLALS
jgi:malonyl CoA-acyl carrier protein transacylase